MAFAEAHSGSFTGFNGSAWTISIAEATIHRAFFVDETTESGDAGKKFQKSKRYIYRVEGTGWLHDGNDDPIYLTDQVSSVSGSIYGRNSLAILQKDHGDPVPVTGAETVENEGLDLYPTEWLLERPAYSGAVRTHLQTDETPLDSGSTHPAASLTLPLGGGKEVSASAELTLIRNRTMFPTGRIEADFQFVYSGAVTTTDTPFEISEWEASIDLNNGQTMGGTVKMHSLRVDLDYRRSNAVPFTFEGIFSGEVSFT